MLVEEIGQIVDRANTTICPSFSGHDDENKVSLLKLKIEYQQCKDKDYYLYIIYC